MNLHNKVYRVTWSSSTKRVNDLKSQRSHRNNFSNHYYETGTVRTDDRIPIWNFPEVFIQLENSFPVQTFE